ncbi:SulP family inorganic anion transporter [Opitutus terrae]|uniref:Sulfate transporter n=1 Tax=Opitutus terrae (strain DSM 11246 / JCM 15787 / PB90-1) TaxID=452637 RepID=B1ZSD7_OPITP|nr:sulfate permease [Opitutus terrae]ACB75736.1 sulfate transporter [Opitutus terrae PB90-1]
MSEEGSSSYFAFRPKLMDCLRGYSRDRFMSDLAAGITVGVVALPLAMAFAIASGVPPQAGIFTAVVAGFIISALGGTRVNIGGPTGAFIVILYGIYAKYGAENLAICTIMAGVILFLMGFARLGSMIKFIPYPVTMGFTSGIAVLIFSTQIKDFLGLSVEKVPSEFMEKMMVLGEHLGTTQWPTLVLALASLAIIIFWPKGWQRRVPGSIVALVVGTVAAMLLKLPVETIGSRFGDIPQALPAIQFPTIEWANLRNLIQPATTIALLAAIESLLCAVVADGMIDDRHDSNQELMAQGLANIAAPLFGGIAATGAIARTATNVKSGGRTPIAGIIHAITLLGIILVAAPLAKFIPLATLSAVLVNVALNMGEWHNFARLPKWPRSDALVFLTAFGLTVIIDLTVAVEIGMVLAAVLFIKRVSETSQITAVDEATETEGSHHSLVGKQIPERVMIYRMFGAFFFGAADKLESALRREKQEPDVLILRMRKVMAIDATGLNALEDLYERLRRKGKSLVLSAPHTQPMFVMENAGFLERIGRENVCPHIDAALERAREILGLPPVAMPKDPLEDERRRLQQARQELSSAIERADQALNPDGKPSDEQAKK